MDESIIISIGEQKVDIKRDQLAEFIYTHTDIVDLVEVSIAFFGSTHKDIGRNWHPMMISYRDPLPSLASHILDSELKDLCSKVSDGRVALRTTNLELFELLANYWNIVKKNNEIDFDKVMRKRARTENAHPAPWLTNNSFAPLLERLKILKDELSTAHSKIVIRLFQSYGFKSIIGFGDSRAKDLIDRAHMAKPEKAITYLKKAISHGEPTFMSYKAYSLLGDVYQDTSNYKDAIKAYSTAMEHLEQSTVNMTNSGIMRMNLLRRGLCYIALDEKKNALQDFQDAFDGIDPEKSFSSDEPRYVEAIKFIELHD